MNESVKFTITEARREAIDTAIRKAIKEKFGHVVAVLGSTAKSARRYTNRAGNAEKKIAGWTGFERYILENFHTVYVGLGNPNEPTVSISEKPDKLAQAQFERKAASVAKPKPAKAVRKPKAIADADKVS